MSMLNIFLSEWQHFIRNRFKLLATLLFVLAAVYGLYNGKALYTQHKAEIEKIDETIADSKQSTLKWFDRAEKGPEGRPWVDVSTPFWALYYNPYYELKQPSPMMVFGVGQAEQYGFYKQITFQASPFDADMAEEIANPERLQFGALDFSFMVLFLFPLLLLIFLYNVKGSEIDLGIINIVYAQAGSPVKWLLSRTLFYFVCSILVLTVLMVIGAFMTSVLNHNANDFFKLFFLFSGYLLLWSLAFFLILYTGQGSAINALKMVGLWILFAFVIPGAVHQWVSIQQPASYMTDLIDAKRDDTQKLYDQPDDIIIQQLYALYPEIQNSPVAKDSSKITTAMNRSARALANELLKSAAIEIEASNRKKNDLISSSYWYNPITFFQNQVNKLTHTHYQNYQEYRNNIQQKIDKTIDMLVMDTWENVEVNKERYLNYHKSLSQR